MTRCLSLNAIAIAYSATTVLPALVCAATSTDSRRSWWGHGGSRAVGRWRGCVYVRGGGDAGRMSLVAPSHLRVSRPPAALLWLAVRIYKARLSDQPLGNQQQQVRKCATAARTRHAMDVCWKGSKVNGYSFAIVPVYLGWSSVPAGSWRPRSLIVSRLPA